MTTQQTQVLSAPAEETTTKGPSVSQSNNDNNDNSKSSLRPRSMAKSNSRPQSQVNGAIDRYTSDQTSRNPSDPPQKTNQFPARMSSYAPTPLPDFSKHLPENVILTDALADVVITKQAEGGAEAYVPQPRLTSAAPDATVSEIEQRLQASMLSPSDFNLDQFESGQPPRASAILSDSLHLRNDTASRPVSESYIEEPAEMGEPFDMEIMAGAQGGQYLMPGYGMEYDQDADRPRTAASTDTYQKAQTLFTDFDGIHYASSVQDPEIEGSNVGSRMSSASILRAPPIFNHRVPPPAPGMVFYPAPVPKTLLLPQRLSRAIPASEQAKRRSQMLTALPADARKSAIWLNKHNPVLEGQQEDSEEDLQRIKHRMSTLPPQLRASMYFENPSNLQEVEIKDKSAVATLEDLLDASTSAPVSAFTDHPFAGKSGADVYQNEGHRRKTSKGTPPRKDKGRSSLLGLRRISISSTDALNDVPKQRKNSNRAFSLGARLDDAALSRDASGAITGNKSDSSLPIPTVRIQGAHGGADEGSDEEDPDFDMPSDDEDPYARVGPPTTLLAELQIRKAAQKNRNRTALTAFPNGMHSTLLELDAVAQVQKKKRQHTRVTLAWEDPDRARAAGFGEDDDDVPLGLIHAAKGASKDKLGDHNMADWDRPMGLIELREREDNEPLAVRKARLQGTNMMNNHSQSQFRSLSGPMLQVNGDALDDKPEETLAQRIKRLKNQDGGEGGRPHSQAFSEELLGQFDGHSAGSKENLAPENEEEETLGQRKARLQREAQQSQLNMHLDGQGQGGSPQAQPARPALRASTSMADLLHNLPIGATRRVSDNHMVSNLPQGSLLKQSEDKKAAHKEVMNGIRQGQRTPSGQFGGRPLLDLSNVDMSKNGVGPNGYRNGLYNNGFGGVGATPTMVGSMMDLQQSMSMIAQQNQMALQMMGAQNQMIGMQGQTMVPGMQMPMNPHMSMQMPMMQPGMPQNPHMSMQMGMGMPPMAAPRMSMNPYGQPMMGAGFAAASTPNLMAGMGMPGAPMGMSTPNLMAGMGMPGGAPMGNPYARHSSLAGMPMMAQDPMAPFVDDGQKTRIENWRQDIQMD